MLIKSFHTQELIFLPGIISRSLPVLDDIFVEIPVYSDKERIYVVKRESCCVTKRCIRKRYTVVCVVEAQGPSYNISTLHSPLKMNLAQKHEIESHLHGKSRSNDDRTGF